MIRQDDLVNEEMAKASNKLRDKEFISTLLKHYKLSHYYFLIDEFLYKMAIGLTVAFMADTDQTSANTASSRRGLE